MNHRIYPFLLLLFSLVLATSCGTRKRIPTSHGMESRAELSRRFGVRITPEDHLYLYAEASKWLGTPYRSGGNTLRGVDCSGFVVAVFREVYGKKLARTSAGILKENCRKVNRSKLREGHLVFFRTDNKKKKEPNHVGIYLKNGKFVHASSSKGVMVSNLSEPYYVRAWMTGGEVK